MVHLYSADRAEPLAERLAEVLLDDPGDPMEPVWLAVPTAGMRRWLHLELAKYLGASDGAAGDGIAANFIPALPGALLDAVVTAGGETGEEDPWQVDRLVWSLLEVAEARKEDDLLDEFLRLPPGGSRFSRARRVADLFDRYHQHRPDMIRSWAGPGDDLDGAGAPLDEGAAWQARLWRAVRDRISQPSPPERFDILMTRLATGRLALDLPDRLLFFGFTALPGGAFTELLEAVGRRRHVDVFLLRTADFAIGPMLARLPPAGAGRSWLRSADTTDQLVHHPLLRSWGRSAREGALLLAEACRTGLPAPEVVADPVPPPPSLLGRLQQTLRSDGSEADCRSDPDDRSVQFHACFGPVRQVQVARDALLHVLAEDEGVTEEDILVLCPRLERFAPLVESVFGGCAVDRDTDVVPDRPSLRFRIADQSIRSVNPVLGAATQLIDLASSRFTWSAVLEFLGAEPVRYRFGFDDDALRTIATWVESTNVRWGIDGSHRAGFGVSADIVGFSWESALERLITGATITGGSLGLALGEVAPSAVEGGDVDTLGRLAEAVMTIVDLARQVDQSKSVVEWMATVRGACDALFATPKDLAWQVDALHRSLDRALDHSVVGGHHAEVALTYLDVRRLIDRVLDDAPGRPDFFRGGVTVSSLAPLRWVPYKVVCLLGMDQDAFGVTPSSAEDLIAAAPHLGDPDPRSDDRQRLLEAVLAAGERLIVVRDGSDVRTNQEVKRSVVVAELFEAVRSLVPAHERDTRAEPLETRHPRHPFDTPCLVPGRLLPGSTWSFDPMDRVAAIARAEQGGPATSLVPSRLPATEPDVVELDDLRTFLRKPVSFFVRRVLGVGQPDPIEDSPSELPVALGGLDEWKIATRLLDSSLDGTDIEQWKRVESRSSTLPAGAFADAALAKIVGPVDQIRDQLVHLGVRRIPPGHQEVGVRLDDGTFVTGSIPLRLDGPTPGPVRYTYSRTKPVHRLEAWLDLLALVATDPSVPWRSVVVARKGGSGKVKVVVHDLVLSPDIDDRQGAAVGALGVVVDCFRRGLHEPVPLFPTLSYHLHDRSETPAHWRAFTGQGDGDDADVRLAFGDIALAELLALPAGPDDVVGEGPRARRYADYLWSAYDRTVADFVPPTGAPPTRRSGRGRT